MANGLQRLGKYQLLRRIGAGGMAEVYLAQTVGPAGFHKTLVVKRLHPALAEDPSVVQMFMNEARLAGLLDHPNVVQVYELGEEGGSYFLAMEFVDGPTLLALRKQAARAKWPIPFGYTARIVALACEGLQYAHDFALDGKPLALVHRDVSPDNIIVSRQGGVKIADFGIAKAATTDVRTRTGVLKGKIQYMSPEQLLGKPLDRRSDVFSLGIVVYELLAGERPFAAPSTPGVIQSIIMDAPPPLARKAPGCPAALAAVVERALEKDPAKRYPDCRTLQRDLNDFLVSSGEVVGEAELAGLVERLVAFAQADDEGAPDSETEVQTSPKTVLERLVGAFKRNPR